MRAYSYYAYAAMRAHFFGHDADPEVSDAVKASSTACAKALSEVDRNTFLVLKTVYTSPEYLSAAIKLASEQFGIPTNDLWTMIAKGERRFAVLRGLI